MRSRISLSAPFKRGNNNWQHYLWDASLEISANAPDARAFLVVEDNGSTSNPNRDVARRAAISQAENALLGKFDSEFTEYLGRTD